MLRRPPSISEDYVQLLDLSKKRIMMSINEIRHKVTYSVMFRMKVGYIRNNA